MIHVATRAARNGEIAHHLLDDWMDVGHDFVSLLESAESLRYFGEGPHKIDPLELRTFFDEERQGAMRQPLILSRERKRTIAYAVVSFELRNHPTFESLEQSDVARIATRIGVDAQELKQFFADAGFNWYRDTAKIPR